MNMNITIIGTGYVGLVTGACPADLGNHVFLKNGSADLQYVLAAARIAYLKNINKISL